MSIGFVKKKAGTVVLNDSTDILDLVVPRGSYLVHAKAILEIGAQESFDGYFSLALVMGSELDTADGHLISSQIWKDGTYIGGADTVTVALSLGVEVSALKNLISLTGVGYPAGLVKISAVVITAISVDKLSSLSGIDQINSLNSQFTTSPQYAPKRKKFLTQVSKQLKISTKRKSLKK